MCLAIPGKLVSILELKDLGLRRGSVEFGGIRREVCLDFTPGANVGNYVLVHVGFSISIIDEGEAHRVFEALRHISQLDELGEGAV